jgi:2-polyprenyl-3-methyl-5-hydroxy-6-metoxy-1,4-benzoquinol methylase
MNEDTKRHKRTIEAYEAAASDYIAKNKKYPINTDWIDTSLKGLPKTAKMIEVGGGDGKYAKYINSLGYNIQVTDVVDAFIDHLRSIGMDAFKFDLLHDDFSEKYDFILANAVLVHFSKKEVVRLTKKIYKTLNPRGRFALSVKTGEEDGWKTNYLGVERYFSYWDMDDIIELLQKTGFSVSYKDRGETNEHGNDWITLVAEKGEND